MHWDKDTGTQEENLRHDFRTRVLDADTAAENLEFTLVWPLAISGDACGRGKRGAERP